MSMGNLRSSVLNMKASRGNLRNSVSNIKSSTTNMKKNSEANLRDIMNDEKSKTDLPYQLRKMGATMDQASIMTMGVINNIRIISGDYVKRSSIDISKIPTYDGNKRLSYDNIGRNSFDKKRFSVDNIRKLSNDRYNRNSSIDNSERSSFDKRLSFDHTRLSSLDLGKKSSISENRKISFNDNNDDDNDVSPLNMNMKYRHHSQQLPTLKNDLNPFHTGDEVEIHSILRHNTPSKEEENTVKPLHNKRLSITFNPIVESNIFIDEIVEEENLESSSSSNEFADGIKPLSYSYGITPKKTNFDLPTKSTEQINSQDNIEETTSQKNKTGSLMTIPKNGTRRRSVYDFKKQNSIHDIVHLYSKGDLTVTDNPKVPENDDDSNIKDSELDDIVPELLKPRNSFLNDDYKVEVQQRRRLSELNRRRSMYSNGRLSVSHNLKSSDSLNEDIDSFYVKHEDFTRILGLRYLI